MIFDNSLELAKRLDKEDELRHFRKEFIIPSHKNQPAIYFLGNSLGLQPKQTAVYIQEVLSGWGNYGVEGFFMGSDPWLDYQKKLAEPLSKIVGALPHEVVVMNQLTVNLHLMLVSFYRPSGKRKKILCEAKAFPSDQYMLETHLKHLGYDPAEIIIEVFPEGNEVVISEEIIYNTIEKYKEELALVFWGGVNYYTGQVFNIEAITYKAHSVGAKAGFDLAHAAGNINLELHKWNVDFACWCSYKYLNSGPGAIGGVFIHERFHNDRTIPRFAGWWGYKKETRFEMKKGFDATATAEGWQLSTPSIILFAAHKAALELFSKAGMEAIIKKEELLKSYLIFLLNEVNGRSRTKIIRVITPGKKGCQVSMLILKKGREIFAALGEKGVFADWREPDVIRIAPVPLYNSFEEVWNFVQIIETTIKNI